MPRAEILSKQAIFTLSRLHAELAGKFADKAAQATRKQAIDLQQAFLVGLKRRDGGRWLARDRRCSGGLHPIAATNYSKIRQFAFTQP
jgi:hypothetical protein